MIEKNALEFDQKTHTYRYGSVVIPNVTTVLENVGLSDFSMVPLDRLAQAQTFGTEVHNVCELVDLGKPVPDSISEMASLYLCHYLEFVRDFQAEMIEVEQKVFCKKYKYAGTLDRVAVLKKLSDQPVIFDIKTGVKSMSHKIQTAAYEYAYKTDKRQKMDRYTLYIGESGYKLSEPYRGRLDFDVFVSALNVYQYKKGSK
jgi:hypothetical protein